MTVLVHGAEYYSALHQRLCVTKPGDQLYFADFRGDTEERLGGEGSSVGEVFAELVR